MTGSSVGTAAAVLVDQLRLFGVDTVFGVPGESYLDVLDAMIDAPIRFVACRQEGGAAMMAEAWGKLTQRPGVCFVTRGPGATNASAGVHVARQDSTPMLLFVGDVPRPNRGREAFQEIDFEAMYGQVAKAVIRIDDARRMPELLARAWLCAVSGRPGPVVVTLPEDMLRECCQAVALASPPIPSPTPDAASLAELGQLLVAAERPFVLAGGPGWTQPASEALQRFAERWALPVGVSFRRQDVFDNHHGCYAGHVGIGIDPALASRIRGADLLLVLGSRLGEITTGGYRLIDAPRPAQTLVHVHPDAAELGRVYQADLAIVSAMPACSEALARLEPPPDRIAGTAAGEAHRDWQRFLQPRDAPGELPLAAIVQSLAAWLGEKGIVCNGAGNYAIWLHRHYSWRRRGTQLAPTSGSMGYGVPAAIAAALRHPDRRVACWAGDGCFLMHGQELATAVAERLGIVFIVVDNGQYGTIRMHQERRFPGRVAGTRLVNPDFVALAQAYGVHAEAVASALAFERALARAARGDGPFLIHLKLDAARLTPDLRL
ncbi:MAG: thiamine pyrophosphate-binding protein [Zoogloeaceae bacterium]|nr:thiamine pyrophosphate-binding protein [Rhodocyclaceae bacterium]MCP5235835.1 thiamine pyrophosphate-binding protein [Zoogloeaceae bacterium]